MKFDLPYFTEEVIKRGLQLMAIAHRDTVYNSETRHQTNFPDSIYHF